MCRNCKIFQIVTAEEGNNFVPLDAIREELQSYICY